MGEVDCEDEQSGAPAGLELHQRDVPCVALGWLEQRLEQLARIQAELGRPRD